MALLLPQHSMMVPKRVRGRMIPLLIVFVLSSIALYYSVTENNVQSPSPHPIFFYRAYYDNRTTSGRVRVLAVSECISPSMLVSFSDGLLIPLLGVPIEGRCPWDWAPGCKWNAYMFESGLLETAPDKLELMHGRTSISVEVATTVALKDTLQLCVPPLYWYTDWPRLIVFFEVWRPEMEKAIVYVHSITRKARAVLDYYEKQGLAEIVYWPSLQRTDNEEDPNKSIYRTGHSLAHNDCVMRASGKYVALVDIDEYLHVQNSSLMEFARSQLKDNISSISFSHYGINFGGPAFDEEFSKLLTPEALEIQGPPKVLSLTERIHFLSTHFVRKQTAGFQSKKIHPEEGVLLHYRTSFGQKTVGADYNLSNSPFTEELLTRVHAVRDRVFPLAPVYNHTVTQQVGSCLSTWRSAGCKSPMTQCWEKVYDLDDWILPETSMRRLH